MKQAFEAKHNVIDGLPAGGFASAVGIGISWQNGPLGRGEDRREPNGAFVETVIAIAKDRIEFYQEACGGRFACKENEEAAYHLHQALMALETRTMRRERAGTEGTHEPDNDGAVPEHAPAPARGGHGFGIESCTCGQVTIVWGEHRQVVVLGVRHSPDGPCFIEEGDWYWAQAASGEGLRMSLQELGLLENPNQADHRNMMAAWQPIIEDPRVDLFTSAMRSLAHEVIEMRDKCEHMRQQAVRWNRRFDRTERALGWLRDNRQHPLADEVIEYALKEDQ